MGIYTERLRRMIENIPNNPKGFTPEIAAMALTQLANASLQVISQLEAATEDLEKENAALTERLIDAGLVPVWEPTSLE